MVSSSHEAGHRIFQEQPGLLAPVFRMLGLPMADKPAIDVLTPDATEVHPLERRVDTVLRVHPANGSPKFLLAIEAQGRQAEDKPVNWSYYLAYLKAKYDCPALLMVVCQDHRTAKWANGPFHLGMDYWTSLTLYPLVVGPNSVPVIDDPAVAAADLSFATLAAIVHNRDARLPAILEALAYAVGGLTDKKQESFFTAFVEVGLRSEKDRKFWRDLMATPVYFPGRGTLVEEVLEEGRLEALRDAVVEMLGSNGVEASPKAAERIKACTDKRQLTRWIRAAATATSEDEIFQEPEE